MKPALKYIELKTGFTDNGPAWIGTVEYSQSGHTIYFDGKALKRLKGQGAAGNYYDIETEDEYWVSGVKRDGRDRHWAGGGKVSIDRDVISLYLSQVDADILDKSRFELIDIAPTSKQKFIDIENKKSKL